MKTLFLKYLRHPLTISLILLLIYLSPFIIFGENAYLLIWDNMCYVIPDILAKSNVLFSGLHTTFPNIMNGVPRNALPGEFNVVMLLFHFFPFYIAHAINQTLIRIIGLVGMYLLLDRHVFNNSGNKLIIAGVSLAFAMTRVCPLDGLSILGLPLVLYAFLNIREKRSSRFDWLIILLIPFYSLFVVSYIFVIFLLGMLWVYDIFKNREINYKFLLALILMTTVFMIVEYRLIYLLLFDKSFVSHRYDFSLTKYSLLYCIGIMISSFLIEQNTLAAFHIPFIVLSVLISGFVASKSLSDKKSLNSHPEFISGSQDRARSGSKKRLKWLRPAGTGSFLQLILAIPKQVRNDATISNCRIGSKYKTRQTSLFFLLVITALFYIIGGLSYWEGLEGIKSQFKILNAFNFSRLMWLEPLLWYIVFALSLNKIVQKPKIGKIIVAFLLVSQIILLFNKSDFIQEKSTFNITYKQFYSERLFGEIKNYIGKDVSAYRIISIGLHPAISQHNGFYTLDAYINNYPLEYKHKFRKIIEKELNKGGFGAKLLRFDNWGNMCYTYVDEIGHNYTVNRNSRLKIRNLDLNTRALKELGGKYIFSAVEILNYRQNNLEFLKIFEDEDSPWKIYLYKVL